MLRMLTSLVTGLNERFNLHFQCCMSVRQGMRWPRRAQTLKVESKQVQESEQ